MENIADRYVGHIRQEAFGLQITQGIMAKAVLCRNTRPDQGLIEAHRQADDEGPVARRDRVTTLWLEFKHIAQLKFVTSIELKQLAKDFISLTSTCTEVYAMYRIDIAKLRGMSQLMQFEESYMP